MNSSGTQLNPFELAKQGNAKALAILLNRRLQAKNITAKAAVKDGCLQVMLESVQVPNQQALVAWVYQSMTGLGAASIKKVKVYGRQTGAALPAWIQEFELADQQEPLPKSTATQSVNTYKTQDQQAIKTQTKSITFRHRILDRLILVAGSSFKALNSNQ